VDVRKLHLLTDGKIENKVGNMTHEEILQQYYELSETSRHQLKMIVNLMNRMLRLEQYVGRTCQHPNAQRIGSMLCCLDCL